MSDQWEQRMAARAQLRRESEQRQADEEHRERLEAEMAEFRDMHPDRWVEHEHDRWGNELIHYSCCRQCWDHDEAGRIRQQAEPALLYLAPAPVGIVDLAPVWWPVQICAAQFDWPTHQWQGCACFCHHLDFQVAYGGVTHIGGVNP